MTNIKTYFTVTNLKLVSVGVLTMAVAFFFGVKTSDDVRTFDSTSAYDAVVTGDMDGDSQLTLLDVKAALELALGYFEPSSAQLLADPNEDGHITAQDALDILHMIR